MYNFEFTNPKTVEEAAKAMAADGAQALGGGQTLLPTMKHDWLRLMSWSA